MKTSLTLTALGALVVAGCVGMASAQDEAAAPAAPAEAAAPPGPPPMPQPITMAKRPDATGGEALYVEYCIMCHGPNGMGTGLLGRTRPVALLEMREGLSAQYVVLAARNGIGNMPAIPRGEVSDADLQAIGEYLAAGPYPEKAGGPQ